MKKYILDFFDETKEVSVEFLELRNNYFLDKKNIKSESCEPCNLKEIRKKYIEILLTYDI